MAQTLYDKLWDAHVVHQESDGTCLLYIDRHLVHEVTSPQAFEGLALAGRKPWRTGANLAVADHNVPTLNRAQGIDDPISRLQVDTLDANCEKYGITEFRMNDLRQGIVHVIGPEQGATLPGMTVVCGDSHTSTHGALGALAFGIGTSEVEHVLATQTLLMKKAKSMLIKVEGELPFGCTAKDVVLHIIGRIGTAGGTGYAIEFAGSTIRGLSVEGRMTICNMAIEAGARSGMVAVDDKTIEYFRGRPFAPTGVLWDQAVAYWRTLHTDEGAKFDSVVEVDARDITPQVTWARRPKWCCRWIPACRTRTARRTKDAAAAWSARCSTWASSPTRRSPTSASTASSSARAPTPASKTCAPPPPWPAASTWLPMCARPWSCRARAWSSSRPNAKGWTRSSSKPVSNGASRAAPCAWP